MHRLPLKIEGTNYEEVIKFLSSKGPLQYAGREGIRAEDSIYTFKYEWKTYVLGINRITGETRIIQSY